MRAMPSTLPNPFAISCAMMRGAFFRRLANSKQTGEAASPISILGGRSRTTSMEIGVVLLDVAHQGFAKAICERQIHSSSWEKEN